MPHNATPSHQSDFDILKAYVTFKTIRHIEEEIIKLYPSDKIKSPVHLSIGQEAIAVGVCMALNNQDIVFSNYRGHAHYIAKGGDINSLWAELYGKENDMASGISGSMHLSDIAKGFMTTSAIVGSAISNAVGFAMADKMRKENRHVICFHGDGATEEGTFWESLNFASLRNIPILFICENNQYAIYSHQKTRMKEVNIVDRAKAFGVHALRVEGKTCDAFHHHTHLALDMLREKKGPVLLECMTDRFYDHVGPGSDRHIGFRSDQELDNALAKDEYKRLRNIIGEEKINLIDKDVVKRVSQAIELAENAEFPLLEKLYNCVYA